MVTVFTDRRYAIVARVCSFLRVYAFMVRNYIPFKH